MTGEKLPEFFCNHPGCQITRNPNVLLLLSGKIQCGVGGNNHGWQPVKILWSTRSHCQCCPGSPYFVT